MSTPYPVSETRHDRSAFKVKPIFAAFVHQLVRWSAFPLALILFLTALASSAQAPESPAKRVLLISTGSRLAPGFMIVDQQILQALATIPPERIEMYAENLDIIRFPAERSQRVFTEYLGEKYADHRPDLVILVFVGNLGITGKVLEQLFPGTPIIVAGLTEEEIRAEDYARFSGLAQRVDPQGMLDLILRLQPDLRRVVVIGGTAESDRHMLARVEKAAESFKGRIDIEFWSNRTIADLRQAVTALEPDTAILFTRMFRDAAGQAVISAEVGRWIGQSASVPVYGMSDTILGSGAVGGAVASVETLGRRAGELARLILAGTPPASLPFEIRTQSVPMFDWRALKRWRISESLLPPDSVVRFRPLSIWQQYRRYIIAGLLIIVAQSAMIVALVVQRRQRQRIQLALQESQQMMELATGAGELGLWSRPLTGGEIWANTPMRALFGFGAQDAIRFDDLLARVHPDDRARVTEEVERAQAASLPFELEYRTCLPDGTQRWVLGKGRTMDDPHSHSPHRMGLLLDITERKRAEEKLRESEERFRAMADTAPVMIWMSGPDRLCTFFNHGWLEFTGRTLEQELGNGWSQGVHADDLERCLDVYVTAFDARREFSMEYRLRRHDGEYRYVLDHGVPRLASDGTFLGYIGTCIDVTERKRAAESLDHQRAFLRQVIDVNPNFIFAKDREGRFTLANQAVAQAYGVTVDALVGKTDADFNSNREEVEFFRRMDLEVMNTLQERFISEERVTDARGNVRWMQTVKRPIIGGDGTASQVLGTSADITQRKKTEAELQEQRAELAHVSRVSLMGELAASLAHELNQPLTAILSNARAALRFLMREPPDMEELREILEDIAEANIRAAEVIRRMRVLVKKEEQIEFATVDLSSLVMDVVSLLHSDALMQDVRILLQLEDDLPPVRGDRIQLQQVVLNVLLNAFDAVKACPPGEREVTLHAQRHEGGMNRVSVSDRGPGLSAEALTRIFEPFYTTKHDGLGMGLSICRSIIEAHGGSLWAENNAERGATFYFTVPVQGTASAPNGSLTG
ncbi:MAG: ABC transporter substrate binding protein [Burkholderiales bacterium]